MKEGQQQTNLKNIDQKLILLMLYYINRILFFICGCWKCSVQLVFLANLHIIQYSGHYQALVIHKLYSLLYNLHVPVLSPLEIYC